MKRVQGFLILFVLASMVMATFYKMRGIRHFKERGEWRAQPVGDSAPKSPSDLGKPEKKIQRAPAAAVGTPAPVPHDNVVSSTLEELRRRFPNGGFKALSTANQLIHTLIGKTTPMEQTIEAAEEFVTSVAPVLAVDHPEQLVPKSEVQQTPLGNKYYFDQAYNGLEVYGGSLSVLQNTKGEIFMVNNLFIPNVKNVPTEIRVPFEEAKNTALADAGSPVDDVSTRLDSSGQPRPVIRNDAHLGPRLAWLVKITQVSRAAVWVYFVDALTGQMLGQRLNEVVK